MTQEQSNSQPSSPEMLQLQVELAQALAKLREQEEKHAATQRELDVLRNGGQGNAWRTTTKKPVWMFRVRPFREDLLSQLPEFEGKFVDESEAIRCFWRENAGKKGVNKQGAMIDLDSTTVEVRCVCLDPARVERIRSQYKDKVPEQLIPALN